MSTVLAPSAGGFWNALESIRGQCAVAGVWQRHLGGQFELFCRSYLTRRPELAVSYPCPHGCGCAHAVMGPLDCPPPGSAPGGALPDPLPAVCQCEDPDCPDLLLRADDLACWELDWTRLARALRRALLLEPKPSDFGDRHTRQIGSWSCESVPVLLTIQTRAGDFRGAVALLTARLRRRFILLAPTTRFADAAALELLGNCGAALFGLDSQVELAASGQLHPRCAPGDLFRSFQPETGEMDATGAEVARRAFALLERLDASRPCAPPSLLLIFRLFCLEELSASRIARQLGCSKPTVARRLAEIHSRIGVNPRELRRLSPHFNRLEAELADSRASHIHRRRLLDAGDD